MSRSFSTAIGIVLLTVATVLSGGVIAMIPMMVMAGDVPDVPAPPRANPTWQEVVWGTMFVLAVLCWIVGAALTAMRNWHTERSFARPIADDADSADSADR